MGRTYKVSQQDAEMLMRLRRSQYESRVRRESAAENARVRILSVVSRVFSPGAYFSGVIIA